MQEKSSLLSTGQLGQKCPRKAEGATCLYWGYHYPLGQLVAYNPWLQARAQQNKGFTQPEISPQHSPSPTCKFRTAQREQQRSPGPQVLTVHQGPCQQQTGQLLGKGGFRPRKLSAATACQQEGVQCLATYSDGKKPHARGLLGKQVSHVAQLLHAGTASAVAIPAPSWTWSAPSTWHQICSMYAGQAGCRLEAQKGTLNSHPRSPPMPGQAS